MEKFESFSRKKSNTEEFIKKSKVIHGDFYDYSISDYKGVRIPIDIICPIHATFSQQPNSHLNGRGCIKCGREKTLSTQRISTDEFIKRCKEINGDRYDYSKIYLVNQIDPIEIICKKHGPFIQKPYKHVRGHGCPLCYESYGERCVSSFFDSRKIEYIKNYTFDDCINIKKLKYDFYLPKYNICVEFDGIQHREPRVLFGGISEFEKTKKRDQIKNDYCKNRGIILIRISEVSEIKNKLDFICRLK